MFVKSEHSLLLGDNFVAGRNYAEKIGHYLDCSDQPCDVSAPADLIFDAALQKQEASSVGRPLAVLIVENHAMPSHSALQRALLSRFLERDENFIFNIEWSHADWGRKARRCMQKNIPDNLYYASYDFDQNGHAALNAFLGFDGFHSAPLAHEELYAFCLDKGISAFFSDASAQQGVLDLDDPVTADIARAYLNLKDLEGIIIDSNQDEWGAKCTGIRNHVMAYHGIEKALARGSNIIVQQAGYAHLFGWDQEACDYESSLCAAYERAGVAVLPVFATTQKNKFGLNILPSKAHKRLFDSVIIDGLSEQEFYFGEPGEKQFIEKLHADSGLKFHFYDAEANRQYYQNAAREQTNEMLRRYWKKHESHDVEFALK